MKTKVATPISRLFALALLLGLLLATQAGAAMAVPPRDGQGMEHPDRTKANLLPDHVMFIQNAGQFDNVACTTEETPSNFIAYSITFWANLLHQGNSSIPIAVHNVSASATNRFSPRHSEKANVSNSNFDYALNFDGLDDYVRLPDWDLNNLTLEAWFKFTGAQSHRVVLARENDISLGVIENKIIFELELGEGHWIRLRSQQTLKRDTWYHISGTYDHNTMKLFINGELDNQKSASGNIYRDSCTKYWVIGATYEACPGYASYYDWFWSGIIDEVRVWDYARSQEEIQSSMNVALAGNEPGLVGYWRFDEGRGQLLTDSSGHGREGHLGSTDRTDDNDPQWTQSDRGANFPRPATIGTLDFMAGSTYRSLESLAPSVQLYNLTNASLPYTVTASLTGPSGTDALSWSVTVPGGSSASHTFDFGAQPVGSYTLYTELRSGSMLLDSVGPLNLQVVMPASASDQQRAIQEGAMLQVAANAELDQMAGIVAKRYQDSLSAVSSEAVSFVTGKLVTWLKPVGSASGKFSADDIDAAIGHVAGKITAIGAAWTASGGIEGWARKTAMNAVSPQREVVKHRQDEFNLFVIDRNNFTWTADMGQVIQRYRDTIRCRVERERIPGVLVRPVIIGPTTLQVEDQTYGFFKRFHQVLGVLVVIGAVIIIILAGLAAVGLSPGSLGASISAYGAVIPGLVKTLGSAKHAVAAAMLILSIVLHLQTEVWVAPAVTYYHDQGLDDLSSRIQNATGVSFSGLVTIPAMHGQEVSLDTHLTNRGAKAAQPLVETYIYSVDGRVVDILSQQPRIGSEETADLRGMLRLLLGKYRAVTSVHTKDQIGLASTSSTFDVPAPHLAMSVEMPKTQLALGEAVCATIHITNSDTMTNTGDVGILAVSNDNVHSKGWLVDLGPGESKALSYQFVPQEEGSYRLRVTATDGSRLLAMRDAGYVVGRGSAVVLSPHVRDVYSPTVAVTIPIDAVNSGDVATTTVLSLVSLDRLHDATPVYTDTHSLSLGPGETESLTALALPVPKAKPGVYGVRLFLGDSFYAEFDFAVAAEDTLFADVQPDAYFHNVGDTVPVTVTVMNALFSYTDGEITATVLRPDGVTNTVTMSHVRTGQYQGLVTAAITGTYQVMVNVDRPSYRGVGDTTFFAAGPQSALWPTVTGRPLLGETRPVTITVHNEVGTPVAGVSVVASQSDESLVTTTDSKGQAVLMLSPVVTETYRVRLEKQGFADTEIGIPVWVAPDVTPPALFLNVPSITNQTPLTVTGLTEAGDSVTINSQPVVVDAQGRFTTTVALDEGNNLLVANATDSAGNTAAVTRTVTLDSIPPTITVTYPPDSMVVSRNVISVTGNTEVGSSLVVSGTEVTVDSDSGAFKAWVLLQPGENSMPVTATDGAGNRTTITRTVSYSLPEPRNIFSDVSNNHWAVDFINRLYRAGVTGGCALNPLRYCPDNSVTRAQMAVFLEKGMHYPNAYSPPNVQPTFPDTAGHWAEDWIEALKSDGITSGFPDGTYRPESPVTRAQMAVFLLKAKHGASYQPPAVDRSRFSDVPDDHWAKAWIEELAAEGITSGYPDGTYRPQNPVTRAEMSVFLVKMFGLP